MSRFAQRGRVLQDYLLTVVLRWPGLKGVLLVDAQGLPLASTMRSRSLEESLAALASLAIALVNRAHKDLRVGSTHLLHLAGQDRQVFLVPVAADAFLVALADADSSPTDLERVLLALARDLLAIPAADAPG